jgi:hypothetical protein
MTNTTSGLKKKCPQPSSTKRSPVALASVVCLSLALCATTQVLCSSLNKTILPPMTLTLDDALAYLRSSGAESLENAKYSSQYSNSSYNLRQSRFEGPVAPQKSYGHSMANSFLSYFFDELESGLDKVVSQSSELIKDTARFIQVPSRLVASQANGLLKSSEAKPQLQQAMNMNEELAVLFDRNLLQRIFGALAAFMIAASAYAYMV